MSLLEISECSGFKIGDSVTVGNGKKVWTIESFWAGYMDSRPLARLQPVDGYTATSAEVGRLKAVA